MLIGRLRLALRTSPLHRLSISLHYTMRGYGWLALHAIVSTPRFVQVLVYVFAACPSLDAVLASQPCPLESLSDNLFCFCPRLLARTHSQDIVDGALAGKQVGVAMRSGAPPVPHMRRDPDSRIPRYPYRKDDTCLLAPTLVDWGWCLGKACSVFGLEARSCLTWCPSLWF